MSSSKAHRKPPKSNGPKSVKSPSRVEPSNGFSLMVSFDGQTTHVMVPIDEYEKLVMADMARSAIQKLEDPNTEWTDAGDLAAEFARDAIVEARKKVGLTQKQLGKKLGLPQSQISRIERHPDRTTVRTLRKMARALNVNISSFLRGL